MTVWRYFHVARPSSALHIGDKISISVIATSFSCVGHPLLDRLIAQFRHHHRPFQCIFLDGDPRRGRGVVRNVPGSSDGGAWRALRADKEEEEEAYRDRGADGDAPCDLPVRHRGSRS